MGSLCEAITADLSSFAQGAPSGQIQSISLGTGSTVFKVKSNADCLALVDARFKPAIFWSSYRPFAYPS